MRFIALVALALASLPASAQLPIADLRASHVVLTEVPTLRFADWPPLTPDSLQVVRVRLENRGPVDVPDANARFSPNPGFLTPALVEMSVPPTCGVVVIAAATYSIDWPIGLLRAGEFRECDFTLRATGLGPMTPPPNGPATFAIIPTSVLTAPPPPGITFAFASQRFTIAPATAVLADYSVRIEPSPVRVDPGTSREVSLLITNRGPQAITAAQTRFYGWFERYNQFGPPPIPPDPFILSSVGGPECQLQAIGPIISPPGPIELTAVIDPPIAPGETRECRIRVEARPNASGERSLRFTQRIFFDGVIDPNLTDNIATLRMIFGDPPAEPVPTGSKTMLAVLALLVMLVGLAGYARLR